MKKLILVIFVLVTIHFAQDKENKYQIAYSSDKDSAPQIYYSDLSGKEIKQITNYPLRDGYPCCSYDGEKIVFYAYADSGKTWSIWTMNRDGSNRQRVTTKPNVYDSSPRWSYDGKLIVWSRATPDWKTNEIWIMNADGRNKRKIPGVFGLTPSFLKNGNILYYDSWSEKGEIFICSQEGKILKQLTKNNVLDSKPVISPDGEKILFASDRDGNREVYVMNVDGSDQKNLSNSPGDDGGPRWSPDGKQIVFVSNRDGNYEVYVMNADGSNQRNITKNKASDIQPTWLN